MNKNKYLLLGSSIGVLLLLGIAAIQETFGKDWFEVKEGEASIFKPAGGGKYAPVARVQIGQWAATKK